METLGLYIHIPFCIKKCHYCDFNSYANKNDLKEQYIEALIKEMEFYKNSINAVIDTIYIGGGTPTCLPSKLIHRIVEAYNKVFNISADCEISIESNPGTLTLPLLKTLRSLNINRLSIGLQSWNDEELKLLGRIHTKDEFVDNFNAARQAGFKNINIDLMFSLPQQSVETWQYTLEEILRMDPEHISAYSLIIEENTKFYDDYYSDKLVLPDEEVDRRMYHAAVSLLSQNGYNHYEISNFSKKGFESKHNLRYWKCDHYIGLGAGAHSYLGKERYSNVSVLEEYISKISSGIKPSVEKISLSGKDMTAEYMFLGLRLIQGININEYSSRFFHDIFSVYGKHIENFIKHGFMVLDDEYLRLTKKGIDVSNQIFQKFI